MKAGQTTLTSTHTTTTIREAAFVTPQTRPQYEAFIKHFLLTKTHNFISRRREGRQNSRAFFVVQLIEKKRKEVLSLSIFMGVQMRQVTG